MTAAVAPLRTERDRSRSLEFALLLILTAVLLLRPQVVFPSLQSLHLVGLLTGACTLLVIRTLTDQVGVTAFRNNPLTICVLGLGLILILSHATQFEFWSALINGIKFAFPVTYYLLIVSVVDSPSRIHRFAAWLTVILFGTAVLALLSFCDILPLGVASRAGRLQAISDVADPNFFAILLTLGIVIAIHLAQVAPSLTERFCWVAVLGVLTAAFLCTGSRGGLIALIGALVAYSSARIGPVRTAVLSIVGLALMAPRLGRMATIWQSFEHGGTGDSRLYLWKLGLEQFAESPLLGIGVRQFSLDHKWVIHNSFLECFAEMGLFGGSVFLGAFGLGLTACFWPLPAEPSGDTELSRLRPCLLGVLVGYGFGLLCLSLEYNPITYLVLGLAGAYYRLAETRFGGTRPRYGHPVVLILVASCLFLLATYLLVAWIQPTTIF